MMAGSTKDKRGGLPSNGVFTFFLCQRTRQLLSFSFAILFILLSTITTTAYAAESTSSSSFLVDDFNPNDWYKRYPYYPPYCSIPSEMQQRKIPPLSAATVEQAGGSKLLHATVVIRHGARTPDDADMQCWQGYNEDPAFIWNCSLTSVMSVPSPHDIAKQEENSTSTGGGGGFVDDGIDISVLTSTTSVALFRKQYDSLLNNPVGDTTLHNELKGSCEVGQLILRGYHQELQNGKFLRDAYLYNSAVEQGSTNDETLKLIDVATATYINPPDGTLPWDPRNLFLRSDDEQRTLMSGQVLIRGMLGPEIETYTDNNHQFPILALHTADYEQDYLHPNHDICPRIDEISERFEQTSTFRSLNESQEANTLRDFQRNVLGLNQKEAEDMKIIDCLMTTICTDRPLPDALNDYIEVQSPGSETLSGTASQQQQPQEQQEQQQEQEQQQPSSSVSSETTNQSSANAAENNSEGSSTNDTGFGGGRSLLMNEVLRRRIQQEAGEDGDVAAALDNGNVDFLNEDGVVNTTEYGSGSSTVSSSATGSNSNASTSATTATTTSSSTAAYQNEQQNEATGNPDSLSANVTAAPNKTTDSTNQVNSHGASSSSSSNLQSANMFNRLYDFGVKMKTLVYTDNDSEFAKLSTAPLWAEILPNLIAKRPGSGDIGSCCPPRPVSKMAVFSGHDSTIMPLLASLGPKVFDGTFAPYASMIVIEMHQVNLDATVNKQLFRTERAFRLIYNGQVITSRMEGCSDEVDLCDAEILFSRLDSFATHARNCSRQYADAEEYPDTVEEAEQFLFSAPTGIMTLIALVTGSAFLGAIVTYFVMVNSGSGIGAARPMRRPKRRGKSRVAQEDPADRIFSADGYREDMDDARRTNGNDATLSHNRNGFRDAESDDDDDAMENGNDVESDDDELI